MAATREVHTDGWSVRLDLGSQVLRLEVPEPVLNWHRGRWQTPVVPLSPALPRTDDGSVSAATLLLKAKQFDDGLYAAVELAAQRGVGRFPGKTSLLRSLAATLVADLPAAAAMIHAACDLGGFPVACPDDLRDVVRAAVRAFLADGLASKPVSFYTWTPELSAIFRQDRHLQRPHDAAVADALGRALGRTPGASEAYDACLRLAARLTNPPKPPGLREAGTSPPFFPASRSHEAALFERLYEDRPIPDGFDLMAELIRGVRSGEISLKPTERSGWYDHQAWSLEPLIVPDRMPERARLELGKRYRRHLEDLFRGTLSLARETHVKQAGGGRGGYGGPTRPIWVHPDLTVEPLPTVYARRAAGYRFVHSVLEEAFGADALNGIRRLRAEGPVEADLAEELTMIEGLFEGAAAVVRRELGMAAMPGDEEAVRRLSAWRAGLASDPDVAGDARMMAPVFYDVLRKKTRVWAFLGWRTTAVGVEYRVPPTVLTVEPSRPAEYPPSDPPPVILSGAAYQFAVPVTAEVYVERLLNRDEFRRHCDRFRTREAILANLR